MVVTSPSQVRAEFIAYIMAIFVFDGDLMASSFLGTNAVSFSFRKVITIDHPFSL
jgi:hypothetical protein